MKKNKRHYLIVSRIALLSLAVVFTACLDFSGTIDKMKEANEKEANELQRLINLPDLPGIIVTQDSLVNPVSLRSAHLYAMRVGAKQKLSGGRVSGSKGYSDYLYYDCILGHPAGTKLLIDGKLYPLNFNRAILSRVGKERADKQGITSEIFEVYNTNHGWGNAQSVLDYESFDSIRKAMKLRIQEVKGIHKVVDEYLKKNSRVDILVLREYNFRTGDTLILKGKIENNQIVPLF